MIRSFTGEHAWLDNFYECLITYEGLQFHSTEAAYQAAKCKTRAERVEFCHLKPGVAKAKGQKVDLRDDWEEIKYRVMYEICKIKFRNPLLRARLLSTGMQNLTEGNWHGDCIWGTDYDTGFGENYLGRILMQIRDELKLENTK